MCVGSSGAGLSCAMCLKQGDALRHHSGLLLEMHFFALGALQASAAESRTAAARARVAWRPSLPPVPPCCTLSAGVRHADDTESGVGRPFGYPPSHPRRCASQGDALEARPQVCSPRTRLEPAAAPRSLPLSSVLASGACGRRALVSTVACSGVSSDRGGGARSSRQQQWR